MTQMSTLNNSKNNGTNTKPPAGSGSQPGSSGSAAVQKKVTDRVAQIHNTKK